MLQAVKLFIGTITAQVQLNVLNKLYGKVVDDSL